MCDFHVFFFCNCPWHRHNCDTCVSIKQINKKSMTLIIPYLLWSIVESYTWKRVESSKWACRALNVGGYFIIMPLWSLYFIVMPFWSLHFFGVPLVDISGDLGLCCHALVISTFHCRAILISTFCYCGLVISMPLLCDCIFMSFPCDLCALSLWFSSMGDEIPM